MLIDWFTTLAQIVNFLILVWLLKHFLYGKILGAMNKREADIRSRFEAAEDSQAAAEKMQRQFEDERENLERCREEMLAGARREVERRKNEMLEEARDAVNRKRTRWLESISREEDALVRELAELAAARVFETAAHMLSDLAGADIEQQAVRAFIARLENMDNRYLKEPPLEAGEGGRREAVVRSAHELSEDDARAVREALHRVLGEKIPVKFERSRDLVLGLSMTLQGREVAWNARLFLNRLEEEARSAMRLAASEA